MKKITFITILFISLNVYSFPPFGFGYLFGKNKTQSAIPSNSLKSASGKFLINANGNYILTK
jgi:hypothetical protein